MTTRTNAEIIAEAVEALDQYYNHPTDMSAYDTLSPRGQHELRMIRHQQVTRARAAVDAALATGASARQLAVATKLPGALIITLASDATARGQAYAMEIAHFERSIREVERMRGADIEARWKGGATKQQLAVEFGVTRPTLDAWIAAAQ